MTAVLKVNQKNLKKIIKIAIESIGQGKVLVCPTDTVYGLVADATNEKAVKKLFKIKKRKNKKAVPIFVKDIKTAKQLARIDKEKERILKKLWPGKVTVILQRKRGVRIFGIGRKTIGLRIPDYRLVNVLLSKINKPLTGTSANISGREASIKIKEVIKQFEKQKNQPDLILDAGKLKKALPSTIIDLTKKKSRVLRRGDSKISNFKL